MAAGRLQADMTAVLEGGQPWTEHRFLADNTTAAHSFQRSGKGKNSPMAFAQLNAKFT